VGALLNAREVAALLGFDVITVRDMARRGKLPAFKIAGQWRFDPGEIADWVEAQRHQVQAPEAPGVAIVPPRPAASADDALAAVRAIRNPRRARDAVRRLPSPPER
jgi:excisionase family DNA binding protein